MTTGDDATNALRDEELTALRARVERLDRQGAPWTVSTIRLIDKYPGVATAALARRAGWQLQPFKANLRKLRELGVTESSGTGHRLSPTGLALLHLLT